MAIFMDRHDIKGSTAEDVARAHQHDLQIQEKYGARAVTYWFDEERGTAFCLIEAPGRETVEAMHREAHGSVPNEIIHVDVSTVQAFLGRVNDPENATEKPLKESAFRAIMFTDIQGSTGMTSRLGDTGAMELLRVHNAIVREVLKNHRGTEVKQTGDGFMASFSSVSGAVECAIAIQQSLAAHNAKGSVEPLRVRIGLSAGEPVTENNDLFGSTVQQAARICEHAQPGRIVVANVVRDLCLGKKLPFVEHGEIVLKGFEEPVRLHEVAWESV
ncbi:MAG TPA: nickel-binding protein [Candidatus Binatia bacterium]|nr:nickel-binding protein [Candidatus Binatia bacterium]